MEPKDKPRFTPPSVDVSRIARKWLDLPYASLSQAERLDLYLPADGEGPFPLILHIHGGAFMMCDKRDEQLLSWLPSLERGYAVASVNYRLSGEALFPKGIQDVKAAIRFLRAHSKEYSLDPKRIAAVGGSSGGNYTAMIALTDGVPELTDLSLGNPGESSAVCCAVEWFGPTDFLRMDDQLLANALGPRDHGLADSPESRYLGQRITEVPELARKANPMTYVHKGMPPLMIEHGRLDHLVPLGQSVLLAEEIERRAGPEKVSFTILEGADHGDPLFNSDANMAKVYAFLDKNLKGRN